MNDDRKKLIGPLKTLARKYAAKHADLSEIDTVLANEMLTPPQLVRQLAEHPVSVKNVVPYLAEVRKKTGIETKTILMSMQVNMDACAKAFPKAYAFVIGAVEGWDGKL